MGEPPWGGRTWRGIFVTLFGPLYVLSLHTLGVKNNGYHCDLTIKYHSFKGLHVSLRLPLGPGKFQMAREAGLFRYVVTVVPLGISKQASLSQGSASERPQCSRVTADRDQTCFRRMGSQSVPQAAKVTNLPKPPQLSPQHLSVRLCSWMFAGQPIESISQVTNGLFPN